MQPESAERFLVEAIRTGSEAAWKQLIERYHGRLLAFARARTPGLSDAEDVVQDALVGFLQSLPTYDAGRSLETYLFTILRYKLVDRLRAQRLPALQMDVEDEEWWDRLVPADGETPSRAAAAAEDRAAGERLLADLLKRLIHDYRDRGAFEDLQTIELLFFAGKRNLDVAELLELDQKAVAGVKFRAIAKLRKFLEESGGDAESAFSDDADAEISVAKAWRTRRLTCLKRSTLGAYALGVLEEPWLGYTQFHLDVVACPMCLANLRDLEDEDAEAADPGRPEQLFASSVGFLSRPSQG